MNRRDLLIPTAPYPYIVCAVDNPKGHTGLFWYVANAKHGLQGDAPRVGPMVSGKGAAQWATDFATMLYNSKNNCGGDYAEVIRMVKAEKGLTVIE